MNAQRTLKELNKIANSLKSISHRNKERSLAIEGDGAAPNGKYIRTYNKRETYTALGLKNNSTKLDTLIKRLGLNPTESGAWRIDLIEKIRLQRELGDYPDFERTPLQKLVIYTVSNLKGGAGKTTTTATVATGLATEGAKNYRVGLIDLDPQGSLTLMMKPNITDDDFSVGDLMRDNYELDKDETFSDLVQASFCETNFPNIKILPSRQDDKRFDSYAKQKGIEAAKNQEFYSSYMDLEKIIKAVENDFDVIFIDTPPNLGEANFAAHYIANSLIMPLKASENDRDSSGKYAEYLSEVYEILSGLGHEGYDFINLLPTAVNTRSKTELRIANSIRQHCHAYCLENFPYSEAVSNTGEDLSTIFDVSGSDYSGKSSTLESAQEALLPLISNIEGQLNEIWDMEIEV